MQKCMHTPAGSFAPSDAHFAHVHIDIVGPLPTSKGYTRLYTKTEQFLSDTIRDLLAETMTAAGEKEGKLAVEKGHYHQGVAAITVVVDGGWSKRSHKHT